MYMPIQRRRQLRSRGGLGDINTIAQAIQTMEGYFPGSLSYTNNNPGNLTPAGQPGCTPVGGYCSFPTYDAGYQALLNQISLDASRGETIAQFTAKYAPAAAGNDPTSYANYLASAAGLSPSDPLSDALAGSSSSTSLSLPDLSSLFGSSDSSGFDLSTIDPTTWLMIGVVGIGLLFVMENR